MSSTMCIASVPIQLCWWRKCFAANVTTIVHTTIMNCFNMGFQCLWKNIFHRCQISSPSNLSWNVDSGMIFGWKICHKNHICNFFPSWMVLIWFRQHIGYVKEYPHLMFLWPSWVVLICCFRDPDWVKDLPHFFPSWIRVMYMIFQT